MAKKKYDERQVLSALSKKGVKKTSAGTVDISHAKGLGNGSWGKLDFLTNHCGYSVSGRGAYNKQFTSSEKKDTIRAKAIFKNVKTVL